MNELFTFIFEYSLHIHVCLKNMAHVLYTGMDNQCFEFSTLIKSQLISSGSLFKYNEI